MVIVYVHTSGIYVCDDNCYVFAVMSQPYMYTFSVFLVDTPFTSGPSTTQLPFSSPKLFEMGKSIGTIACCACETLAAALHVCGLVYCITTFTVAVIPSLFKTSCVYSCTNVPSATSVLTQPCCRPYPTMTLIGLASTTYTQCCAHNYYLYYTRQASWG